MDITAEQFIEMTGQLEGDLLEAFYSELDTSEDFADAIVKEMGALPEPGKELVLGEDETATLSQPDEPQPQTPTITREMLVEAMAQPDEYQSNPTFRAEVTQGFEQLYGTENEPESNPLSGRTLWGAREESSLSHEPMTH